MRLEIISPEESLYSGEAELVTVPGANGSFTILERHAPIISSLQEGTLTYRTKGVDTDIKINGGFVEVKNNITTICID